MGRRITIVATYSKRVLLSSIKLILVKQSMYRLTCIQLGTHGVAQLLNAIILYGLRSALVGVEIRSGEHTEFAGLYRRTTRQLYCDSCCIPRAIIDWVVGRARVGMAPSTAGLIMQISRVGRA